MIRLGKRYGYLLLVIGLVVSISNTAMADMVTLKGKIGLLDDYYVLDMGEKKYYLDGILNEDLLGKSVEVIGYVEKDDVGDDVLVIESIKEIEPD
jgi:hypothetical protein